MKNEYLTIPVTSLLLMSLAICGCATPVSSQTDESSSESPNPSQKLTFERMSPLVDAYRDVDQALDLNEMQGREIDKVKNSYQAKFENWYANQGVELKQLEKKFLNAAKRKDLVSMRKMKTNGERDRMSDFKKQERAMQVAFERELIAAIPAGKLDLWKAHRISVLLLEFLEPLELSKDQIQAVKNAGPKVIRNLGQEANWQGYGTSHLEKHFQRTVMLPAQESAFNGLIKKNRMRMLSWNNLTEL